MFTHFHSLYASRPSLLSILQTVSDYFDFPPSVHNLSEIRSENFRRDMMSRQMLHLIVFRYVQETWKEEGEEQDITEILLHSA